MLTLVLHRCEANPCVTEGWWAGVKVWYGKKAFAIGSALFGVRAQQVGFPTGQGLYNLQTDVTSSQWGRVRLTKRTNQVTSAANHLVKVGFRSFEVVEVYRDVVLQAFTVKELAEVLATRSPFDQLGAPNVETISLINRTLINHFAFPCAQFRLNTVHAVHNQMCIAYSQSQHVTDPKTALVQSFRYAPSLRRAPNGGAFTASTRSNA